jgi:UDP-N-acetylglucosamine 4,6-dehydratase
MEKIAVTGATGYLGEKLVEELLRQGKFIHAIARNEGKLMELKDKFRNIEVFPCPIEDEYLCKKALKGCTGIFHLASFKNVNLAEKNALKTVQTNIIGTTNLLKATIDDTSIRFIVGTSSDKAEDISSIYGASKFIVERLFDEFSSMNSKNCKYRIVRYGNIMHSTSSVLVRWKQAILEGKELIITHPEATRFFITREQAIDTLFECLEKVPDSRPYTPVMKSIRLQELLDLMLLKYGTGKAVKIIETGLEKGENKHESLDKEHSSEMAIKWDRGELLKYL